MCPIHRESRIGLEQFRRGDRGRKQSAGFSVRQRFQQNAVNHREDRCDGANAQRERQDGEGGEGLLAGENSKGMFHAYLILPTPLTVPGILRLWPFRDSCLCASTFPIGPLAIFPRRSLASLQAPSSARSSSLARA